MKGLYIMKKLISLLLAVLLCFSLCACSSGSSSKTNTCKICGRSYAAGDSGGNFMNIAKTGMCKNCYNNYKYISGAIG